MNKVTEPPAAEHASKQKFAQVFGHGHDGCNRLRGRATDKDADLKRSAFFNRFLVVSSDVALDLVMQAAFVAGVIVS